MFQYTMSIFVHLTQLVLVSASLSNEIFCCSLFLIKNLVFCACNSSETNFIPQPQEQESCRRLTQFANTLRIYYYYINRSRQGKLASTPTLTPTFLTSLQYSLKQQLVVPTLYPYRYNVELHNIIFQCYQICIDGASRHGLDYIHTHLLGTQRNCVF